jgi:hypothetical protein
MKGYISIFALCIFTFAAHAGDWFFKDGKTEWKIYLPEKSGITEKFAARELKTMLKKISNADFEIISGSRAPAKNAVVIGPSGNADSSQNDSFSIETRNGNLYLKGNRPRATLYAVYSFLQKELGVRWFWIGEGGEYFKPLNKWCLPTLNRQEKAAFLYRAVTPVGNQRYPANGYWLARNKINYYGKRRKIRDLSGMVKTPVGTSSHLISVPKSMFKQHSDWFSMVNGKRIPDGNAGCWSNPEFTRYIVDKLVKLAKESDAELMNVFPADITTRCQCPGCTKDPDPSSRWYDYYRKLQNEIHKTLPKLRFAGIAYMEYRPVPRTEIKGLDFVMYCQSDRCYVHKFGDPKCKLNQKSLRELKRWTKKTKMAIYGYHFDAFNCPMMLPFWNILADEIRHYHKNGDIVYMKTEFPVGNPKRQKPENMYHITARLAGYIYAQLIWNPNLSVDEIIDDWCKYVFGPAAPELAAYYRRMAENWENSGAHITYYTHPPQGFARKFVDRKLIEFAEKMFKKAAVKLKDHPRELKQLKIEAAIFDKWKRAAQTFNPTINVIKTNSADGVPARPMIDRKKQVTNTKVRIYRNDEALIIRVDCQNIPGIEAGKPGHDDMWGGGSGDLLEIFLSLNDGSQYRHFAMNRGGGWYDALGGDKSWDINWKRKITKTKNGWIAEIELPFAELKNTPKNGDQWNITVNRYSKPHSGFPAPVFHDPSSGAVLKFTDNAKAKHNLVWIGTNVKKVTSFFPGLLSRGWNYRYFETPASAMKYDISDAQMIILTVNNWQKVPKSLFTKKLIPAVRDGAVLLLEIYQSPLAKYFGDKSFALRFGERNLVVPRRAKFAPQVPVKLREAFPTPPPAYYIPGSPDSWKVLGKIGLKDGSFKPFLLTRRYGKGIIFVTKFNGGWPRDAKYVVPMVEELYKNAQTLGLRH